MNERRTRLLILLSVIVALILCVGVFCACEKDEISYSVMLPGGEHYTVTSSNIVNAKRGAGVVFDVNIEDGYALYSTSSGVYLDGKLVVENVRYDMTIIFDVRKKANVTYDTPNAKVEIIAMAGGELCAGEKATISALANENYNLESLTINGKMIDLAPVYGGGGIPSKIVEIVLEENMLVKAIALGDEYSFNIECDSSRGSYTIERDSMDEKYRYGDTVTIKAEPIAPNFFGYYNYNGQLIKENKPLQVTINGATSVKIQFYNEFEHRIIYNPNGGIIADNAFLDIFYTVGEYVNIDHCYNRITRDGYSLVGLREGLDGEIHRLGAMAKIPKTNLELYAIWEEWTDSSYFLSEAIDDNSCRIVGYTPNIGTNSLTKLVIPEIIGGRKVVEISANAFKDNQYLQEVVFSKNTVTVGDNAFASCPNLTKIMIFDGMKNKPDSAFANCPKFATCEINAISAPDHSNRYISSLAERFTMLKDQDRGQKMVFVSGSSSPYGLDTQLLLSEFPQHEPLVAGNYYATGIRMLLDMVASFVKSGDIVILTPEYGAYMYGNEWYGSSNNIEYIQKNYDLTSYFDIRDKGGYLNTIDEFFGRKQPRDKVFGAQRGGLVLNKYGIFEGERAYTGSTATDNIVRPLFFDDVCIKTYKRFMNSIADKNVKVYFTFPPLDETSLAGESANKETRLELSNKIRQGFISDGKCFLPVISEIDDYLFAPKYFFDSSFHMNHIGAKLRTTKLCKDIKAQFAKEGK